MKALFLFSILMVFVISASAQTKTWAGTDPNGGEWNNPDNWSPSGVPTINDDVIIKTISPFTNVLLTQGGDQFAKSITLKSK